MAAITVKQEGTGHIITFDTVAEVGNAAEVFSYIEKAWGEGVLLKAQQYQRLHGPNTRTISAWDLHFPPKIRYSCQHNSAQLLPSCIQHRQQTQ